MGISIWQLLIILLIVLLLFGAKRLRNVGSDLGSAVKGFKKSMKDEEEKPSEESTKIEGGNSTIEGEATEVKDKDKA